jgi:hypothetical protein
VFTDIRSIGPNDGLRSAESAGPQATVQITASTGHPTTHSSKGNVEDWKKNGTIGFVQ